MSEKYDVAIIGAGIGGLVCGCYLAKAGLKVVIVEQQNKPGGYCTSFERQGYRFDVGVHYLGSLREGGILFQILKDFQLLDRLKIITNDPTDRIITPDKTIYIRKDKNDTKQELIMNFPKEKENITNFFNFVLNDDFLHIVSKTKNISFKILLDNFFSNYKLKAILSILLGSLGLPPSQVSALASVVFFREFILDGGYYTKGGIQSLPDLLTEKFKEYSGEIILSNRVKDIVTKGKKIIRIELEDKKNISIRFVVSNADATFTFKKLLNYETDEIKVTEKLKPSASAFLLYFGLNKKIEIVPKHYTTWFFLTYDIEKCYSEQIDLINSPDPDYILCTFSSCIDPTIAPDNKSILRIFVGAKYADKYIWDRYKDKIYNKIIEKVNYIIPNIQDYIEIKEMATPYTLSKFTSNREGALFGWSSILSQIDRNIFPTSTSIENLHLVGHWVTHGAGQGGVATVALSGRIGASLTLKKMGNRFHL